jgi:hypothetical protein
MRKQMKRLIVFAVTAGLSLAHPAAPSADVVSVRYVEGLVHGFLALKTTSGVMVARGDLLQQARGNQVTSRLVYAFKDGSVQDETAVFSQRGHFQLVSDHLVQKGPAFEQPIDMRIEAATGSVTVRYKDDHGVDKMESERMELPPDLANGLIITLLKNVRRSAFPPSVSYVAATPKPRLVKLELSVAGTDAFVVAGASHRATHYLLKVSIGGITGVLAPLVGKQPQDSHIWILEGEAPAFVKSESPLFLGGPMVRTELVSPVWR